MLAKDALRKFPWLRRARRLLCYQRGGQSKIGEEANHLRSQICMSTPHSLTLLEIMSPSTMNTKLPAGKEDPTQNCHKAAPHYLLESTTHVCNRLED